MTEYFILIIIMLVIYFVLIRNRATPKSDWESLATLEEYKKVAGANNAEGQLCCQYCGHLETVQRVLNSEKENADKSKFYHACTSCKVILWRSEKTG